MGKKTNAMRLLDQNKVAYQVIEYTIEDGGIDGVSVAHKIEKPLDMVFKTLVVTGGKNYYVVLIPVDKNLNLKAVAKHVNEKKIEMIHVKDIMKITGYIRGGCSPLGMKKHYRTLIDASVDHLDEIVFSAGKQGLQIQMKAQDFIDIVSVEPVKVVE